MSRRDRSSRARRQSLSEDDRSPSSHGRDDRRRRHKRGDESSDREHDSRRRGRSSPARHHGRSRRDSLESEAKYSDDSRRGGTRSGGRRKGGNDEEELKHYIKLVYKEFKAMLTMVNDETEMIKKHPSMTTAPRSIRSLYKGKVKMPKRPDDSRDTSALDMIKELEHGMQEVHDKLNKSYRTRFFKQVQSGMERKPNESSRRSGRKYRDGGTRDISESEDDYEPRRSEKRRKNRDGRDRESRHREDRYEEDRHREDRHRGDRHRESRRREDKHRDNDRSSRRRRSRSEY